MEKWENLLKIYVLFVNFKKANNSIHRQNHLNILKKFNFFIKLINLIATLKNTIIKVKVTLKVSSLVKVTTGLRQGYIFSPTLFNLN